MSRFSSSKFAQSKRSGKSRGQSSKPRSADLSSWRWAIGGGFIGILVAVLIFAPAQWLAFGIDYASKNQVQLLQSRGTIWNGSAELVFTGGAGSQDRTILPSRLIWQLRPVWNGLNLQLQMDCCIQKPWLLQLRPSWGSFQTRIGNVQGQWPASLLTGLGTPWNTLQIQGQLHLKSENLQLNWAAGRLQWIGQAQIQALSLSSRLSTLRPMGSYQMNLQGGDGLSLHLQTLEGSLLLNGQGQWVGGRLRFNGTAEAAPEREAALDNLLNIIGRRSGSRSIISL